MENVEIVNEEYKLSFELVGHERDIKGICQLKNGQIATSSRDKQIKIWTLENKEWVVTSTLLGHESFVGPIIQTEDNELVSGGYDNVIIVWDLETNLPKRKLEGHEKPVVCLTKCSNGDIISGSWDKVIRVWGKDGEVKKILRGHNEAVWDVLALDNGDIWSASADRSIKIWKNGNCWKTLTTATDCVRGLCKTDTGVASVANDTILRLWDLNGNELAQGYGHSAYVYCVKYNEVTKEIVTGGEDSEVKIWKGNQCTQSFHVPGSVWCLDIMNNGDILTGSSDYIARIWTKNSTRVGNNQVQQQYQLRIQENIEKAKKEEEEQKSKSGLLDYNKLPNKDVALMTEGFEGQQIIVKNENGEAEVYVFEKKKWNLLGVVTDNPNTQGKKHVFPVELDGIKYEMGYNEGDNIYEVAEKFLANNNLDEGFLEQVIEFLLQNTKNLNTQQPKKNVRPNTSFFPSNGTLNFSNNKFDPVIKKLKEFNVKALEQASDLALDDTNRSDSETLNSIISKLTNTSFYHSTVFTSAELLLIINICSWPGNLKFPGLDILRQMLLVESSCEALENAVRYVHKKGFIDFLLDVGLSKNTDFASRLLTLKTLCNMSKHAFSKELVLKNALEILDRLPDCTTDAKENVRETVASLLLNFASTFIDYKAPNASDIKLPIVSMIGEAFDTEKVPKIILYYLLALGTVSWNDSSTVSLLNDLSITEKIDKLTKHEISQISEASSQLYQHIKSFDMDTSAN